MTSAIASLLGFLLGVSLTSFIHLRYMGKVMNSVVAELVFIHNSVAPTTGGSDVEAQEAQEAP